MPLSYLSRSCYTSIEGLGNPQHLRQNRHKNDIKVLKLVHPNNVSANALSEFMLKEISLGIFFFTINNLSLQQSILYDIIVYMALNKNIQCIPCINKNNPSQGKTFYKMESLELSTRFVTDSEHKKSINQILNLASRDYFYVKIIFHTVL